MTPDRADVKVMQTMVDTMVSIPRFSYPARQNNANKPSGEFAHIRVLEEYAVGIPQRSVVEQDTGTIKYLMSSPVRLRYRIGVVDTTGLPSSQIQHGWTSNLMRDLMLESGYGFIVCHPLSNEDSLLEKEWEYRKGFSVEMYTTRQYEQVVNTINGTIVEGTFYEEGINNYLLNFNINE